jgi:tetratricopeptide (TPR) repeat protein
MRPTPDTESSSTMQAEARRRSVPPPPGEWCDELAVLAEADGTLGLVLWRALRDIWLVLQTPPERQSELFPPITAEIQGRWADATEVVPELREAIEHFASLRGGDIGAEGLASACEVVSEWAAERQWTYTAVAFAEAAARLESEKPSRAQRAGQLSRRGALYERAVIWYQRAYGLAVRTRSRRDQIQALNGYGAMLYHQGRGKEARPILRRVARRAEYTGRKREAAEAHHDLMAIAAENGTYREGETHGRSALILYPISHPRVPYLVHDIGYMLCQYGLFAHALPLFDLAHPFITRPYEELLVWGNIARAAGGVGDRTRYREARSWVSEFATHYREHAPAALSLAAEGALLVGEREEAAALAQAALKASEERQEAEPERRAHVVLVASLTATVLDQEHVLPARNRIAEIKQLCAIKLEQFRTAPAWLRRQGRQKFTAAE